jgi:nitrogen fixation/metabolism regulation signal transduction histidine kinase
MIPMPRLRLRMGTKVALILLGLSLLTLLLFTYVAFSGMRKLSNHVLQISATLGEHAVTDSTAALRDQAENYLLHLAVDQAAISSAILAEPAFQESLNERIAETRIGKAGFIFVINSSGEIIARTKSPVWDEFSGSESLLDADNESLKEIAKKMIAGNTGITACGLKNGKLYIAYAPIADARTFDRSGAFWSVGIAMPVEEIIAPALVTEGKIAAALGNAKEHIDRRISYALNTLIGIFVIMMAAVCTTAYRLSKRITKSIMDIGRGAKIVGSGDLDYQVKVKTGDDLEELANSFNKMTHDLKIYAEYLKTPTQSKGKK